MKRLLHLRRILALFLTLLLLGGALPALADGGYDHQYTGPAAYGDAVSGFQTALLQLQGGDGQTVQTYCVDSSTYIVNNGRYERTNLEATDYFTDEQASVIRAIVRHAYPFVSLDTLRAEAGLPDLTEQEAITGAQLAIWSTSNANDLVSENATVTSLKSWFLALSPMAASTQPVGKIELTSRTEVDGDTCTAYYRYSTTAVNSDDGTPVSLTPGFSEDLGALGATIVSNISAEGVVEMRVTGLPPDANFTFFVTGTQNISSDAYFYSPQGGRCKSQSLVGAYSGDTVLYAEAPFSVEVPGKCSLKVQKYDSTTGLGVEGALFRLSDNEAFTDPTVYEKRTDASGMAEFSGLTPGVWYLREAEAPTGYVPDKKVYPIDVDEEPNDIIRFKNSHTGEIRILKTDPSGAPLEGALFDIYTGHNKEDEFRIRQDLRTDGDGLIFEGNIPPGDYLIVETRAPEGYHLADPAEAFISINPHQTVTVTMVNPTIQRGKIAVAKEDYSTGEKLPGAVIGLYPNADCKESEELGRVVTEKDSVQYFEDLLPGTYFVKELEAPEGYIINPAKAVVEVELTEGAEETVTFRNRKRIDTAGNFGLLLLIGGLMAVVTGLALVLYRRKLTKGR